MDDPSVKWSKDRYDEIQTNITPFLEQCGYAKDELIFVPISGLCAENIKEPVP
jgi:peptide chain release factor subunit 3